VDVSIDPRYAVNKAREDEVRAYNAKMKPIWDAEKALQASKANREQLLYLAKETGTKVSPFFLGLWRIFNLISFFLKKLPKNEEKISDVG
jgi:hypothetical protein